MSIYFLQIGESLANVLERAASSQPEVFAGYVANLPFWIAEFEHLTAVHSGFEDRLKAMRDASARYLSANQLSPQNIDDVGTPYQDIQATTRAPERNALLVRNQRTLGRILDRARDLGLLSTTTYDELLARIGSYPPA